MTNSRPLSNSAGHPNRALRLVLWLKICLVMIVGLMALGAGVRTMNAGLSCPDWPLCFGKVIPDFHPAVWFEFVHRAYAGLVALVFFGCCVAVYRGRDLPKAVKVAAGFGLFFLILQIVMGGLTVLMLVKSVIVTSHLMLATLFFASVLWMLLALQPRVTPSASAVPRVYEWFAGLLTVAVLVQIAIGGLVASTYAGSVCVDWPLCNGQWVPTWSGAIGTQIIHRLVAYALSLVILVMAVVQQFTVKAEWMTSQLRRLGWLAAFIVLLQVVIGVANLMLFIPPSLTVVHQTTAIVLLAVTMRIWQVARVLSRAGAYQAERRAPLSETPRVAHTTR